MMNTPTTDQWEDEPLVRVRFAHEVMCCCCYPRKPTLYGLQDGPLSFCHLISPLCEDCARMWVQAKTVTHTKAQARHNVQWKLACQGIVDEFQRERGE